MVSFFKTATVCGVALAAVIALLPTPSAVAQQRAAVQARAVQVAPAPQDRINEICDPSKVRRSRRGGSVTIRCAAGRPVPASQNLAKPPNIQRAEINGQCKEVNGKMTCSKWTCTEDQDSNCKTFVSWCIDNDGDVNGNGGSATCTIP